MKTFLEFIHGITSRISWEEGGGHFSSLMAQAMSVYLLKATMENLIFLFGDGVNPLFYKGDTRTIDQMLNMWRPDIRKFLKLTPEAIEKYQISYPEELYIKQP